MDRPIPWAELNPEQQRFQADKMAVHAAMVDRMDREIGRLLEQVRAMGAFEDTLVLFLSDNGASAGIMLTGGGHDATATQEAAKPFSASGPVSQRLQHPVPTARRPGPTGAASAPPSSPTGRRASPVTASCVTRPRM
ncbi:MAG: sulfatase-like hydrolase/transferase [Kiritimatiellia bacterium]